MTIGQFLVHATATLTQAGIESARLDVLVLLEDTLERDRASLLAHPEEPLSPLHGNTLSKKITRRAHHTPLAYIRGHAAFFGREFSVGPGVLIPRPETEDMIVLLKEVLGTLKQPARALDVGTGSGCIGITAALEIPWLTVDVSDISIKALRYARENAKRFHLEPAFLHQNLLAHTPLAAYDILLANLPYVPRDYPINAAAAHEPRGAIFGGTDGLAIFRQFWQHVHALPTRPRYVFTESLMSQHGHLAHLADHAGYTPETSRGLIQQFRRS